VPEKRPVRDRLFAVPRIREESRDDRGGKQGPDQQR
jgi:hypothetical protein